ncbi:MAG: hypothetical protein GXP14_01935 [Gammaproteobacteria bacterium]|nr:hypothetical protein [Gammaproteobacteria bacterium]
MKSAIFLFRISLIIVTTGIIPLSFASEPELRPLEWADDIQPGISEAKITAKLNNMGVAYFKGAGGLTYTSKVVAGERDYLFCQGRLYAIVEGVFATGKEFNKWFQAFLAAHRRNGAPDKYSAQEDWGRFRAEWSLDNSSTLYFQLQSNLKDKQGWSRQLYANDIGASCLKKVMDR